MTIRSEDIRARDVSFLPIVAAYVKKLGIVDGVNRLCPTMGDVSAGQAVMALILDTLSGRSPLYKIEQSFVHQDMELLFGVDIPHSKFNDDAVGRTMDALFDTGKGKILRLLSSQRLNITQKASLPREAICLKQLDPFIGNLTLQPFIETRKAKGLKN